MPTPSRRDQIVKAFARAEAGPPIVVAPDLSKKYGVRASSKGAIAVTLVSEHQAGRVKPGGMTSFLTAGLERATPQQVGRMKAFVQVADHEREMGHYGDVDAVAKSFNMDRRVVDAIMDGVETDFVCAQLQERRGSDADLPPPELTRRDVLSAAVDAASGPNTEQE